MGYQDLYTRSIEQPAEFWQEQASHLHWFTPPTNVLSQDEYGNPCWFQGGKLNTCYLALDFHVAQGRGHQTALIYDSPVTGVQEAYSYEQLLEQTARLAGALLQLGVAKGDRVVIYMPMIPETVIAMLACARIGAIHSVVFGGFAARELAIRIDHAQPRVLLTASAGKEIDRVIDYASIVDAALAHTEHSPEKCLVFQRPFHRVALQPGRDVDWEATCADASPAGWVECDATDPLYILYTSGTTGRPKGVVRDHGGHAVALNFSMSSIYDTAAGEVFWAASDVGWVVGHSYIVYGPLIHGCTTVLYEGKPVRTPDAGGFWRVVAEHDVRVMFTAPTAIRAIKRDDPEGRLLKSHDTSGLRYLFLAGERCDVSTLAWSQQLLNLPVIDHWWLTETGWPVVANMAGVELLPIRPGSATKPVCGYDLRVFSHDGAELPPNEEGALVLRQPLPPGCLPTLWRDHERFQRAYLTKYPGYFLSGDGGYRDEEGYVYITGRLDDIINVAGHRLSTATIEEAVAAHPAVAECAVVGKTDPLKGEVPLGFVILKSNADLDDDQLQREVVALVRERVGAIASLKRVIVVHQLPKTRSGKILRGTIRQIVDGQDFRVPSTIEDPSVLDELGMRIRDQLPAAAIDSAASRSPQSPPE